MDPDTPPFGPDLDALVRARPSALVDVACISRHGASRPGREAWRLGFADGTRLKARRLASAARAATVEAIVARLDPERFPRVVARRGAALLEEWVEGESPEGRPLDGPFARWAGETLSAVHRTPPPPGLEAPGDPCERLEDDLSWLEAAGALPAADAARLRARRAPSSAPALVHRDLCPENLVRDRGGRLHVVDNAAARLGHREEDLARTFYRWPMERALERAFLDAYAERSDPAGFLAHRGFWTAAALAHAARVRLARGYARATETVERLLAEAAG